MGSYAMTIAGMVMGNDTTTPDWYLGLWYANTDPVADIVTAEITNSRVFVPSWTYTLPYVSNAETFYIGPLDACTVGGWFLANGATNPDVAWVGTFGGATPTPIVLVNGDYLRFDPNTVNVGFDVVVAGVTYPPANPPTGGGGDPPPVG